MFKAIRSWWLRFIGYKAVGTHTFHYHDINRAKVMTISVTFLMKDDNRKIELDYDPRLGRIFSVTDHSFYHNVCIPFLRKTGDFAVDAEQTWDRIHYLCTVDTPFVFMDFGGTNEIIKDIIGPKPEELTAPHNNGADGNVVQFPANKDDFQRDK